MPDDPHKPLRDDVRLLGELLGQVLRAHEGDALFQQVEHVRALAKRARSGSDADFDTLATRLSELPVDAALPLARAFAHFLNLANIAEQHHRVRRRRAHRREPGATPQPGSCEEAFDRLLATGVTPDRLYDAICNLQVELVLTAHPTEVSRRTLVQKFNRIAAALDAHDEPGLSSSERDEVLTALLREIMAAWGTAEIRDERPEVLDEVRAGLIVFEQSLWHAMPSYLREVDRVLRARTGRGLPGDVSPVRFGSWIGGDRDGNPNVTPDVTRRACLLHRWMAADLYLHEIEALRDELSMRDAAGALAALADEQGVRGRAGREPYREVLRLVRGRLLATRQWIEASLEASSTTADLTRSAPRPQPGSAPQRNPPPGPLHGPRHRMPTCRRPILPRRSMPVTRRCAPPATTS